MGCGRSRQGNYNGAFKSVLVTAATDNSDFDSRACYVQIRPLWRHYFQNTQGLIFVVDSNDRDRVGEARDELHRMLNEVFDSWQLVLSHYWTLLSLRQEKGSRSIRLVHCLDEVVAAGRTA